MVMVSTELIHSRLHLVMEPGGGGDAELAERRVDDTLVEGTHHEDKVNPHHSSLFS